MTTATLPRRSTSWEKDRQLLPDVACRHGSRFRHCILAECLAEKTRILWRAAKEGQR